MNLTQEMLNIVLTNITLSAMSLQTWSTLVPVNKTEYRHTYEFSEPLALVLPYGLSLAFGAFFAAVGVWSLGHNGVPAADGGFLQVMLATRGDTHMERLAIRHGDREKERISEELKTLKIRYGALMTEDRNKGVDQMKMGFGTIEETASVRRRR